MFLFNLILYNLKVLKHNANLARYLTTFSKENLSTLSLRQKTYNLYQKIYENYDHIYYSSCLELQEENMSYELKRCIKNKIKTAFNKSQYELQASNRSVSKMGENWMDDYEYYSGTNGKSLNNEDKYGTPDPSIPSSNVPCSGCGALLNCKYPKSPGYLPTEIFKGRTENELKTVICQRCHFLKHYNQALDVEISPDSYVETISSIKNKFALAIVIVDLLDFPCSIWPGMHELLGTKRPVFIVGNKVDLLPRDSNSYLNHIKECLKEEILKTGFHALNIKNISLISAKTGYGIEELITQLQKIWAYKGDVYLMGCTNVGKSSLFNILLNSDYSRPETSDLIRKATTCPWPGTTLHMLKFPIYRPSEIRIYERFKRLKSEKFIKAEKEKLRMKGARKMGNIAHAVPVGEVGRSFVKSPDDINDIFALSQGTQPITTFNEKSKLYQEARWVIDTPGVSHPEQITNILTQQEIEKIQPSQMISPRSYRLKPGMSLFLAGLSRLDFINSDATNDFDWVQVFLFASFNLPTMIVDTTYAADIYNKYLNTPLMKFPIGNEERLKNWPGLQCHSKDLIVKGNFLKCTLKEINCSGDIILSSTGWVGLKIPIGAHCTFRAWTPNAKGVYLRTPSLVPYAQRLIGKRIRNSLAYNTSRPFVFKK